MKIGIFVELYRPHVSGVVISVETLISQLLTNGHQVVLFAPKVPCHRDVQDFPVVRLPSFGLFGKRFAIPFLNKELTEEIKNLHLDLVHIQGPYSSGILGIKIAQKFGLPVVMTYHTHVLFYLKSWTRIWSWPLFLVARILALWLIRWISKKCQLIITPSHFIENVLRSYGITTPIELLPTGVQPPSFLISSPVSKSQLLLPEEGKILLYVGRISKEKNLVFLLDSFEKVARQRDDVVLVLIGEGPFQPILERIVERKKLKRKVLFLGSVPHEKIFLFLKASDIFVFPSLSETQGLSVAEAMSVGLPVVVIGEGGAPEFVDNKKTGLVVQNNSNEFASAILSLLESPDFAFSLGRNAQKKMLDFSPELIYQKLARIYEMVIRNFNPVKKN